MATKSQEILLKGNTTNASAVPSSLKVREIAINALDRSLFTNDGNSIVKLYTGTTKWFDVNGNANNALKLGGILASEYINKEAFNSHINNSTIHITSAERTAWNNKWDYDEETIKGVKVNAAVLADKATIANSINTLIHSSITTPSAGWYRIAYYPTRDMVRGLTEFQIYTHGGDYKPIVNTIRINGSWALASMNHCIIDGLRTYIGNIRTTYDDTNVYIEFYCNNAISAYLRVLRNNASVGNVNETWEWYTGALPEGGGTEVSLFDGYIDYVKTAETLRATRYIFGQPFDGSADCNGDIIVTGKATISGDVVCGGEVVAVAGEGTPAGVTDYSALTGKPSINGVTLVSGNNTLAALGIQVAGDYATNSGVTTLLADYAKKTFVSNNYVGKSAFNSHTADSIIHITSAERAAWNAKWNYDEATIKAVKVNSASSADSVAWTGISGKPTTFTPSAHTHTASEVSGLPTSLKNPFALTFGSKTYDGSAAKTITASDLGALTSITKSMVEGVLTGDITSHTHSFASLTSKPTTIAGYGITDAYTSTTIDSKLSGYLPLIGGTLNVGYGSLIIEGQSDNKLIFNNTDGEKYQRIVFKEANTEYGSILVRDTYVDIATQILTVNDKIVLHSGNYNSYAPTLTGTGASGTWGINISGNAASAQNLTPINGGTVAIARSSGQLQISNYITFDGDGARGIYRGAYFAGGLLNTDIAYSAENYHKFYTGGNWSMSINSSGNVTIGASDSAGGINRLFVYDGAISGDIWADTGQVMLVSSNDYYLALTTNESGYSELQSGQRNIGATPLVLQKKGGNVLIGTGTDNGYKLQVNGSERVYGDLIVDGEVSALVA